MPILIDKTSRVICQGLTGRQGSFHMRNALAEGTQLIAGVTPGKGGGQHLSVPVFNTVSEACAVEQPDATIVFVPPANAAAAMIEAIDCGISLIVCITERIPMLDMVKVKHRLANSQSTLVGPNCIGVITPQQCRLGIMPSEIFRPGKVGIISRSGTLTYEAIAQTTEQRLGQSSCVGIGGDLLRGLDFVDCLKLFQNDPATEAVVMLGEVGGSAEEEAADYIKSVRYPKPVVAYIAGQFAPPGRRMGHAGAIVQDGTGTARAKINKLRSSGVHIAESPVAIGSTVKRVISRL